PPPIGGKSCARRREGAVGGGTQYNGASAHEDAMAALPLTVVIPTLNEARNIADLIESLRWADDVIVADGGSRGDTVTIARGLGARVFELQGQTLGNQRNVAIEAARHPWVLALDADERVSDALRDELAGVLSAPKHDAYRIRFANIYLGR